MKYRQNAIRRQLTLLMAARTAGKEDQQYRRGSKGTGNLGEQEQEEGAEEEEQGPEDSWGLDEESLEKATLKRRQASPFKTFFDGSA